jgi:agmatine deiminase
MPAEWEPHAATLLAWPSNRDDWPGKFQPIPWVFAEIVRHLVSGERVRLIVQSERQEARVRGLLARAGVDASQVLFLCQTTDRGWMRDVSPFFVVRTLGGKRDLAGVHFGFNGWAKYRNWKRDSEIPARLASEIGIPLFRAEWQDRQVILEGGAIDVNGQGTLLTTEECLLDPVVQVRNPGFTASDYAEVFRRCLGVTNVMWLGKGIAGDDTRGHVDDLCRFVNADTVVLCAETNPRDENYRALCENQERLERARLETGARLNVVSLPMPAPLLFNGVRLPASYANFYIANEAVLVPTFNDPTDRVALGVLAELFPDRPVVGVHAVDLVWGLGTVHCLSHEVPRAENGD